MKQQLFEIILALAIISGLALSLREEKGPRVIETSPWRVESALLEPLEIIIPSPLKANSVASIHGVRLGMALTEVEETLSERFSQKDIRRKPDEIEVWKEQVCVIIHFNKSGRASYVSGSQLEIDGLTSFKGYQSYESVLMALGAPTSQGCASVGMCEGPFGGVYYNGIRAEISFSWFDSNKYTLGPEPTWLDIEDDPNDPCPGFHY